MGFDDLRDVIEFAGGGRHRPCLVELGRALHPDGTTRGYIWSTGAVGATVGADWVHLRRRLGHRGDMRVGNGELRGAATACRDWARRRDGWAAFVGYSGSLGSGMRYYYRAPGAGSERVPAGASVRGRESSEPPFAGRDEPVALDRPIGLRGGARLASHIWRREAAFGPTGGSLVGAIYAIGGGELRLLAYREHAELRRGDRDMRIWPDDAAFIAALVAIVKTPGRTGPSTT